MDQKTLVNKMADAFEDGRDPFSTAFLVENNIDADSCMAMSNLIAVVLRSFASAPKWVEIGILSSGVQPDLADHLWRLAVTEHYLDKLRSI
jgi:hypothetical protein